MVLIVDFGVGNVGSVANMFRRIGVPATVSSAVSDVLSARALVLPGVGAFDVAMKNLQDRGLVAPLDKRVREDGVPVLGICLGMQLLTRGSEEGDRPGLGWLAASTKRFQFASSQGLAVPHMGWNDTTTNDASLFAGLVAPRFYYVHSYYVTCDDPSDVAATCNYGSSFCAAVRRGNIFGTQFHPEKSHAYGKRVLQNFAEAADRA